MIRRVITNALIVCIALLLTLFLLEVVIRVGGETDADGQFTFMGYSLEPYVLPISQLRFIIEGYLANEDKAVVIYDATLGWTYRPNSKYEAGVFTINGAGLRSQREYSQQPLLDTLRIAIFGDSFTAGYDVNDDEVWGHQLEIALNQAGIRAEVLNFGVGAYGMGQAYLRWQSLGRRFEPDIVIFGFQPENLNRNVNVFRQLMHASGPPFSKPRFVLTNQQLELINSPTLPPEQLIAAFEDFGNHPLASYEFYYRSRYVASKWWTPSRVASLFFAALKENEDDSANYGPDSEGGLLGKAIVDAFAKDVLGQDAAFVVLNLPIRSHLIRHFNGIAPPYEFLIDHLEDTYNYIPTKEHIGPSYVDEEYWGATNHYGAEIHRIVAELAADEIKNCIENSSCSLPRFADPSVVYIGE